MKTFPFVNELVLCIHEAERDMVAAHLWQQSCVLTVCTYMAAVTTGSLAAYMGKGYWDKRKVFPQGVLAALSTVLTLGYIGSL